eukprot:TRINITY_DN17920_c0_g1_i1.p1 TRINITY_DN17920_c0_g1~~TRINITY_DN17920_c0_g1_i1.p1  ORF type:complete len:331 (+),score=33.84 TRINITY_DN17920_c0_g1_i1:62-994(+)
MKLNISTILLMLFVFWYIFFIRRDHLSIDTPTGAYQITFKMIQDPTPKTYCNLTHNCLVWDEFEFSDFIDSGVFITTYVVDVEESRADPYSPFLKEVGRKEYYISGPEAFQMKIEHTMVSRHHSVSQRLLIGSFPALNQTFDGTGPDKINISDLISATNLNLEEPSDVRNQENATHRQRGSILALKIKYKNLQVPGFLGRVNDWFPKDWALVYPFYPQDYTYSYSVDRLKNSGYKISDVIQRSSTRRTVRKKYGIRIYLVQTGLIGHWDIFKLVFVWMGSYAIVLRFWQNLSLCLRYVWPASAPGRVHID